MRGWWEMEDRECVKVTREDEEQEVFLVVHVG